MISQTYQLPEAPPPPNPPPPKPPPNPPPNPPPEPPPNPPPLPNPPLRPKLLRIIISAKSGLLYLLPPLLFPPLSLLKTMRITTTITTKNITDDGDVSPSELVFWYSPLKISIMDDVALSMPEK